MKIQFRVLWAVTPWNDMVGYQRSGGTWCLHLQGEVNRVVGTYFVFATYFSELLRAGISML